MMRPAFFIVVTGLLAAACGSNSNSKPDAQPLVTRQAPPLEARPKRMNAVRTDVSDATFEAIQKALMTEAPSSELIAATGLAWADGRSTVAVAHVHFPPQDMAEADLEAAVDDAALQRCDEEFTDCVDGLDTCQQDAYETCIRTAYSNAFVYMASHLGVDCAVFQLSMYALDGAQPMLLERRALDSMACDFDAAGGAPAAADIDGDGGPELVYTWSSSPDDGTREADELQDAIVILDATELTEQFRHVRNVATGDYEEHQSVMGLTPVDADGDGLFDLRTSAVNTTGYCVDYTWALDARFVVPEDATSEDEACAIDIDQTLHRYDVQTDTWVRPDENERPK